MRMPGNFLDDEAERAVQSVHTGLLHALLLHDARSVRAMSGAYHAPRIGYRGRLVLALAFVLAL